MRKDSRKIGGLYLLVTEEYCRGRNIVNVVEEAISGGVDMIQLRQKERSGHDIGRTAKSLADICRKSGTPFIINDDPLLARDAGAHGVHLGQEDLKKFTVRQARDIMGDNSIIGLSAGSIKEVERANAEEVDYVGFGPVFPTAIKENCVGIQDVESVLKIAKKPVFFIGGIGLENIDELLARGAKNIAVIRAITQADDIKSAVESLKNKIKGQ